MKTEEIEKLKKHVEQILADKDNSTKAFQKAIKDRQDLLDSTARRAHDEIEEHELTKKRLAKKETHVEGLTTCMETVRK